MKSTLQRAETLIEFPPGKMAMSRRWILASELEATLDYYEALHGQRPTLIASES